MKDEITRRASCGMIPHTYHAHTHTHTLVSASQRQDRTMRNVQIVALTVWKESLWHSDVPGLPVNAQQTLLFEGRHSHRFSSGSEWL